MGTVNIHAIDILQTINGRVESDETGDSFLLEWQSSVDTSEKKYAMIDPGGVKLKNGSPYHKNAQRYLNKKGIKELEFIIITHHHYDHNMEAPDILGGNIKVKKLYAHKITNWSLLPSIEAGSWDTKKYHDRVFEEASKNNVEWIAPTEEMEIRLGGATLKFYNTKGYTKSSVLKEGYNIGSMGVLLQNNNHKIFFGGDMMHVGFDGKADGFESLHSKIKNVDVYFLAHHGSEDNTSKEMAEGLNPKVAIQNRNGGIQFHEGTYYLIKNGAYMYSTYKDGDIVLTSTGEGKIDNSCVSGKRYIFNKTWVAHVNPRTGVITDCYFDGNGKLFKHGWFNDNNKWYWFEDYKLVKDMWKSEYNQIWFYLTPTGGSAATGWKKCRINNESDIEAFFYFEEKSVIGATYQQCQMYYDDWVQTNGKWYWLKSNGQMAQNESIYIKGKKYYFDYDGICTNP